MGWSEDIRRASEDLLSRLYAMQEAEVAYLERKEAYERAQRELAGMMRMNGLTDVGTDRGCRLVVVEKAHCNINRNQEAQEAVASWMESMGFDAKVKRSATVSYDFIQALRDASIPHREELSVNTNSVKAVITDLLANGQISLADIPQGCHYYQEDIVEVRT